MTDFKTTETNAARPDRAQRRVPWPSRASGRTACVSMTSILLMAGCRSPDNRMAVVSLRDPGSPQRYFTRFDESVYRTDAAGNLDIVLRGEHEGEGGPGDQVVELVHLHAFWKPIPGTSFAERSMINTRVKYLILTGDTAILYEGAGFATFRLNRRTQRLTGRLEAAQLVPTRRRGPARDLFGAAQLKGTFSASPDDRRALQRINDMARLVTPPAPTPGL